MKKKKRPSDPFLRQVYDSARKVEGWPEWRRNAFGTFPTKIAKSPKENKDEARHR